MGRWFGGLEVSIKTFEGSVHFTIFSADYTFFKAPKYTVSYSSPLSPHTPIAGTTFFPPLSLLTSHKSPASSSPASPSQTSNLTSFTKTFYTTHIPIGLTAPFAYSVKAIPSL